VAVVGSLGKSTTPRSLSAALGCDLPNPYQIGFDNAYNSVALRTFEIRPFAPYTVVEAGIREPGQMAPIARMLRPNVSVVTSIKSDHYEYLGTLQTTRHEKSEMVRALPASGTAVLNGDDPNVRWMEGQTSAKVVTFGFGSGNDVRADNISLHWPHGMQFRLHAYGETRDIRIRLVGKHMVYAVVAAVAVALAEGLTLAQVIPALASLLGRESTCVSSS
jgi:UDP-N-acetylmuramoyl-tripeptide--D-alanyl-D-alanine ligase